MPGTLAVALNRDGPRTIDGPSTFETDGSFVVELTNHGQPVHAHVRPDGELSRVARVEATNHYVESDDSRRVEVHVDVPEDARIEGRLEVTTNYGAVTHPVEVAVDTTGPEEVRVDPDLSTPEEREEPPPLDRPGVVPAVVGVGVALAFAVVAALVAPPVNVLFGGLAVVALFVGLTVAAARR